jgi:DNA helicase-2/ATP-dependent DNA helicase PcrA
MIDMAKGKIVKKAFVPSSYQKAIFEWVKGDGKALVVKALAGSGKTTTGIKMLDFVDTSKEIVYLAFNKHIAEELKTRVAPHVKVMTYHALGYAAVRQAFGNNVKIDNEKVRKLLENYLDKYVQRSLFSPLEHLVSLVKGNMTGTSPEDLQYLCDRYNIELNGDMALAFQIVPMVVARSLEMTSVIDFDDMCYFPVALNLKAKQYDFLFVDEAQDTNKCQIALALMSMKDDGRIVAVGDEYQSIYGFRGADVDAIPNLIDFLHAETLPLSVTYRCPKTHVEQISKMFPEIGLESSDSAKEGIIRTITNDNFLLEVRPLDMILCRTNAPLVGPAFGLIRKGVKAVIRGRDIGNGLVLLVRKMKADGISNLLTKLQDYTDVEIAKLHALRKDAQAVAMQDKFDTIVALCDGVLSITELEEKIDVIFSDTNEGVIFSSVHKAKGLEAERVYILKKELMPHKMAKLPWEIQQERNIQYVAYTRSLSELIFVE